MFYDVFERLCEEKGKAVTAVAREVGISPNAPQQWRSGSKPRIDTLYKLAEYFGVPLSVLTGREPEPQKTMYPPIITEDEMQIVGMLRTLTPEQRQAAVGVISSFARQQAEQKKTVS